MRNFSWTDRLIDVLNEIWTEVKESLSPPKPKLKPVPVDKSNHRYPQYGR
ncbi:MAG: hypothetical protein LAT67_00825 [Balneolales bacterium]|nr:hypothetical protein [Balneolales bacterium]